MEAKTVALFSTKGGVGVTFIASNLAVSLCQDRGQRVALLDFDTKVVGDMARMLGASPKYSLVDVINRLKHPPQLTSVKDFMHRITDFNIDFLPVMFSPRQYAHLEPGYIKEFLGMLKTEYDFIIIDAGKAFSEPLFTVFNNSNLILMVVTPDVLSVYQTKWSLDMLQSMHFPLKMIKVVLNRSESQGAVAWQEVRASLPCEIITRIPSEGKVVGYSVNRRVPVVVESSKSRVASSIIDLSRVMSVNSNMYIQLQEAEINIPEDISAAGNEGDFWRRLGLIEPVKAMEEMETERDEVILLKKRVHQRIIEELDLKRLDLNLIDKEKAKKIRERTEKAISNALALETNSLLASFDVRQKLVKEIADEALGLGPLEDLISDPDVTDIMVNNRNQIYIERHGKIELTSKRFVSDEQVRQVIERIIAPLGRHIDESNPMVDARLPDGSRVNAIIPPLSLSGPMVTVRKFGKRRFTMDDLVKKDTLNNDMVDFLRACVLLRKNMVVSGGTGSGKTTVLNVLSEFIPDNERIITIEDAAEIKLHKVHWARLESRPPNIEGRGAITIRDLFRNTLRMRPDRIIIGECRGGESLDMLQAMNTGHDGSLTTIHANSTQDVLSRLDSMILMSGAELPIRAIREMIASAIDIIVHTARLSDGTRKITQISEITGMLDDTHIEIKDVYIFKPVKIDETGKITGYFSPTGYVPSFAQDAKVRGIDMPEQIFVPSKDIPK